MSVHLMSSVLFYSIVVSCFTIIGGEKQCSKIQVATWPPLPAERVSEFFWISRSGWAGQVVQLQQTWRWNLGIDWNQKRWGAFKFDSIVSQGRAGDCESPA